MTVSLRPLGKDDFAAVQHIIVAPEQVRFSGTVREAFEAAEENVDFHAICDGEHVVGFFKIDTAYGAQYPFAGKTGLGLRAFIVDLSQQGKGIATKAVMAMPEYLRPLYPNTTDVFLTVNFVNLAAKRAYLKGGFEDTGEVWPHGNAGPQNILRLQLA